MSAHDPVAAIVALHAARLRQVAAARPASVATQGHRYQPGQLVIDRVTGQEAQVVYGSRETVLTAPAEGPAR